ncbi:MAG: hypothetical protein M1823_004732 [Watsoniomyces obsoletus]|nr:MAG: hypothetical protein M1823_004732 [Watsoniomyces obsoletus]
MAYLASIHKPSSIRHSLKLDFFGDDDECLVVAKANTLEFYRFNEHGLRLRRSISIFARVTMLEKLRPASATTDHLFVGTDRHGYFTLSFNAQRRNIQTEKPHVDLVLMGSRDARHGERCTVDPNRRLMVLEVFEGVFTIVPINEQSKSRKKDEVGNLGDPLTCRIPQFSIRSRAVLHGTTTPTMALLCVDATSNLRACVKELQYPPEPGADTVNYVDQPLGPGKYDWRGARLLIPIPEPTRGVLVLCDTRIVYISHSNRITKETPLPRPTIFVTWVSLSTTTYLLGDDYGKLHLLEISVDDQVNHSLQDINITMIGAVSRPTGLVRMTETCIFVGSHQGDAQLIELDLPQRSIEIVQTLPNIAPIVDFTIMDLGNRASEAPMNDFSSGQARIVTGSGAFQDGSLRSVRSGVGLEERACIVGMEGIQGVYKGLSVGGAGDLVDVLIVSLLHQTRLFHCNDGGEVVEEQRRLPGLSMRETTIVAGVVGGVGLGPWGTVQVTPSSVRVIEARIGGNTASWATPDRLPITDASLGTDANLVLLALGGVRLVLLDLSGQPTVVAETALGDGGQIACVHVPSIRSDIAIVGLWQGASIAIVELKTLRVLRLESLAAATGEATGEEPSVPRSLLLANLVAHQPPTLLVALANGTVLTFAMDPSTFELRSRKSIRLGTQEVKLQRIVTGPSLHQVFASCEHPSLIYGDDDGRIVCSAITSKDARCVGIFDTETYPDGIAVATSKGLTIALIDRKRRTHVRDLHLGETVRRVAYSPALRAFAVGSIKRTLRDSTELMRSQVKLVDEVIFDRLATYDLNPDELVESVTRAELRNEHGEWVERFLVGTGYPSSAGYLPNHGGRSLRGRILVFEVDEHRTLQVLTELEVKGACRCLQVVQGRIVAALLKAVVVYALEYEGARASLVRKAAHWTATVPVDLAVVGSQIIVGDVMKSMSILEYHEGSHGMPDSLEETARDFRVAWTTAVAAVADDTYLEATGEGNLNVLHATEHDLSTTTPRRELKVTSEMNLGECVNRIRTIDVAVSSNAVVIPRAFLGTTQGSIYLFALISPKFQDLLMQLQSRMAVKVSNPGGLSFNNFRAHRSALRQGEEPFRFVDGDLIERFLDSKESLQEDLVKGLGVNVEDIRTMVESLRGLR